MTARMHIAWKKFKAYLRLDLQAVCDMSVGDAEYHDYPDSTEPYPWHFYIHTCSRCGKNFTI